MVRLDVESDQDVPVRTVTTEEEHTNDSMVQTAAERIRGAGPEGD